MSHHGASGLGACWDGRGVTFTLASRTATGVDLCLRADDPAGSETRVAMQRAVPDRWTARVEGVRPGQGYGFRVSGPWDPKRGLFHNPHKLLLDPYARAVTRALSFHPAQTCATEASPTGDTEPDPRDSAIAGLWSLVIDESFDWSEDRLPRVPWRDTVIYECHVKGMTALNPRVPAAQRGRYLGLCAEPIVAHLRALGVTTVSLMPVAASFTERRLVEAHLVNYWGYQPVAWLAPTPLYASAPGAEVAELKRTIRELHRAGIEVILDVVLNHSGEGPSLGPAAGPLLGLRGVDPGYFRRDLTDPRLDQDFAGCGNTLDLRDPLCLGLALDCLRYWARAFHVDGFRLDLAPILCRADPDFDPRAPLLHAIADDPLLAPLKWIAEPWDLGPNGYCLGRFPSPVREWNDRFRDGVRRYMRGDAGARAEIATRLAGSADFFGTSGRAASSSVNYVACHDGFPLWDLVSYAHKHNHDNGEHNRDGRDDNLSRSWGVEGETDDANVIETRRRVASSMLVALACAQGVPMLGHGDELARTQHGNNNAYCQDRALSYVAWDASPIRSALLQLTTQLFALRRERPALRVEEHRHGDVVPGLGLPNLSWLGFDGQPLRTHDWHDRHQLALAVLRCEALGAETADLVLALWNPTDRDLPAQLPAIPVAGAWTVRIDTAATSQVSRVVHKDQVTVLAHCAMVLTWDERA